MGTRTRKWLKEGIDIENPAKPPREPGPLTRLLEEMPTPARGNKTPELGPATRRWSQAERKSLQAGTMGWGLHTTLK